MVYLELYGKSRIKWLAMFALLLWAVKPLVAQQGTITGTVSNSLGEGIQGVNITVYEAGTTTYVDSERTDAAGQYSIEGLPTGS
jgi:hypothetical protein